jgi:hypothetical protein
VGEGGVVDIALTINAVDTSFILFLYYE